MDTSLIPSSGRGLSLPSKTDGLDSEDDCKGDADVISCTFRLLDEGEKKIKLDNDRRDVIMVLGNTGSGKSTFTQWLAGDNTKLISKETEEGTGEYIIEDHNRISNTTLKSKTIFPELVIDAETNAAYYDCPGFSDTQGTSHEIAETYFVKKVLDFSESVKMIFTVSYPSVRKGVDRQEFMKLMRHATDLVKDIEKFKRSIAMVATKVDNVYIHHGKDFVSDGKVIAAIADFLQEAKQYLEDESKGPKITEKEKRFYENAIKFVEVLLEKEGGDHTRIGLFRRPDMPGPVSDIPLLQNGKKSVEKIVYDKLAFTTKSKEDFGYTVSEKTKNGINDLVEEINKNLWSSLGNIAGKIHDYSQNLVDQIRGKILLFVSETDAVDATASEAEKFRYKFTSAYNGTLELLNKTSNLTNPAKLAGIVNSTTSNLDLGISKDDLLYIANQGNYFNFLQTVSDKKLNSRPWDQIFKDDETFLSDQETIILQDVNSASEKINDRISIKVGDTIKEVQEEYAKQIMSLEIQKLPKKLNQDCRSVFEVTEEIRNETTVEKLVNATRYVADNLKISLQKQNLQNIANQGKYLKFLEIISDKPLNINPITWLSPFENLAKYFYESEKWYTFLENLYNRFSEYDIQKNWQVYNVADLEDWGQSGKPEGIFITPNTFEKFLNKITNYNITDHEAVKNITTTGLQMEELNQVLSLTLKQRPTVECSEPNVIVKGSFISLNETMENLITNSDKNNSCKNFKDLHESGKFKLFKLFALSTVFIDTDLSFAGKRASVAVIAPKWEVIGSRSIDLSGTDGTPPAEPKAKSGAHPGNNGVSGVPGNPGVSGESFLGVGATFSGGEKLTIHSTGGKGGHGQDAGDGAAGVTGTDAPKPARTEGSCGDGQFRGFRCDYVSEERKMHYEQLSILTSYKIYGLSGGRGGNGGDGGKGGKGGHPGNMTILELGRTSKISTLSSEGTQGEMGKAGDGGQGGKNGDDVSAIRAYLQWLTPGCEFQDCSSNFWDSQKTIKNTSRNVSGSKGTDGKNEAGIKDPVPANGVRRPPNIINECKYYLRENINNRFQKGSLLQFLEQMNRNVHIRKLYDTLAFMDEFRGLEEQFYKLSKEIDFSLFYNSLSDRIKEFAKSQEHGPNSEENKKVLNYLYTATLGRVYNLRENSEQSLIIDIRGYLNLIEKNIETLKDLQKVNIKVDVINKYKENYKSGIDRKIEEAKSLIEKEINPYIETIDANIDEEVNSLIEETIAMQKQAEIDLEKLAEKKKQLEKAIATKGLFNCLKIMGGAVSFLGPIGAIAGTVIDLVSTVGESFALDDEQKILNLPSDVVTALNTLSNQIKEMRNQKITYLNKILDDISKEIEKNPEKLSDMTDKINEIREKLNEVSENKLDFKQVGLLKKEIEEQIKTKQDDLKIHSGDEKSMDALKVIDNISEVLQFGSLFFNMHNELKQDEEKIHTVTDAMEEMKDKIKMLKEYEEKIYDTIAPMLQEMKDHMKDIRDKLGTKSQVALDITKWQVQNTLKDMKLQMQRLTEGHGVKDDLSLSIEKLDAVMTTLITIYDRMQSYQEQQNLANYIADISSVAASSINIKDQQLVNAVNHLEFAIRANIVLEQYKSAIDALKQWVFPFADRYIEETMLPSQLQLDTSIENLVQKATREIGTIKQKIDLYDTSVRNGDQFLECGEFSSRYVSSRPFFTWKSEEYGSIISNLLSGKEAFLKADIKESPQLKDAIKFSEIDFVFKIKNETAQSVLSEILKEFDIRATHLGNSYYRYANKISLITSDSVTISYSYEKDANGIPIRSNEVYNKLKSGDLLLSPYTLWEVKLINQTDNYSLQGLERYKNDVSLELSGIGSYVDSSLASLATNKPITTHNDSVLPILKPNGVGLNGCKGCKQRSARSVNGIAMEADFMTNEASKGIASPINFLCNFLKMYFVSNLEITINGLFFGEKRAARNFKDLPYKCSEASNIGPIGVTVTHADTASGESDCIKEGNEQKSEVIFHVNFNGNSSCSKLFLLSDQNVRSNNHSIQVPDLNCSLLLADLVTRTVTGNRYKTPIDECLLSAPEVILMKISNGVVRNEYDVKQMLQCHLYEKEEPSHSMFSRLKNYATSLFQFFGLVRNDDAEKYVEDVRKLFD